MEAQAADYERWRGVDADGREVLVERWAGQAERVRAAAAAAVWLDGHSSGCVARVLRIDGDSLWSIRPQGAAASAAVHRLEAAATILAAGRALRTLHEVALDQVPVRRTLDDLVELAAARVGAGMVEADELREPYVRFGPERLLALARGALERVRGEATTVVSHGACSLDHLYLDDGQPTAWLRLDALAAGDPHLDLARLAKEVADRMGPEAVPSLFDAYGVAPDMARLDALALLDELLPR
jgi:aminoglycoside 3'-phosphotransferase-2